MHKEKLKLVKLGRLACVGYLKIIRHLFTYRQIQQTIQLSTTPPQDNLWHVVYVTVHVHVTQVSAATNFCKSKSKLTTIISPVRTCFPHFVRNTVYCLPAYVNGVETVCRNKEQQRQERIRTGGRVTT